MFLTNTITPQLIMECSKYDDELAVKRQEKEDALKRLHKYQRMYKKAIAGMIRTEDVLPSESDLKLLEKIIKHNKKK